MFITELKINNLKKNIFRNVCLVVRHVGGSFEIEFKHSKPHAKPGVLWFILKEEGGLWAQVRSIGFRFHPYSYRTKDSAVIHPSPCQYGGILKHMVLFGWE